MHYDCMVMCDAHRVTPLCLIVREKIATRARGKVSVRGARTWNCACGKYLRARAVYQRARRALGDLCLSVILRTRRHELSVPLD